MCVCVPVSVEVYMICLYIVFTSQTSKIRLSSLDEVIVGTARSPDWLELGVIKPMEMLCLGLNP